jgi:hypothetical protein
MMGFMARLMKGFVEGHGFSRADQACEIAGFSP